MRVAAPAPAESTPLVTGKGGEEDEPTSGMAYNLKVCGALGTLIAISAALQFAYMMLASAKVIQALGIKYAVLATTMQGVALALMPIARLTPPTIRLPAIVLIYTLTGCANATSVTLSIAATNKCAARQPQKKGAINVVEQEFKKAQKEAQTRSSEEKELRRRIQAHRRAILEKEQRERMLEDMKADRALGAEVVRMSRAVIQPELNPSVASTMTEESMAAEEEDAEEEEAEEPEPAADLVGMSEQEKRLMGAMGKHVD